MDPIWIQKCPKTDPNNYFEKQVILVESFRSALAPWKSGVTTSSRDVRGVEVSARVCASTTRKTRGALIDHA